MKRLNRLGLVLVLIIAAMGMNACWSNPEVDAGYVAYVYEKPIKFGEGGYEKIKKGPGKVGLGWCRYVHQVDIRPKTFQEDFKIMGKDDLNVTFSVEIKMQVKEDEKNIRAVVENYGYELDKNQRPMWYTQFVQEQFRMYVRDAVKDYTSREAKDKRNEMQAVIKSRVEELCNGTPFVVMAVMVGNIEFPGTVANAVEQKMKTQQDLERKQTEIEITKLEAQKEIERAKGVAEAQRIINESLTERYLQYLGIMNLEKVANGPNTTVFGIPLGANMVPIVQLPPSVTK